MIYTFVSKRRLGIRTCNIVVCLLTIFSVPAFGANWYVNDTSTIGDSYTTAVGADTNPGTNAAPFFTLKQAIDSAAAGDTIYIDAGIFDSFVTVNTTETAGVNITKDSITLIGKDSASTIIDPPGAKTQSGLYGIYADTQTGLTVKNIAITGVYDAIHWLNVDYAKITSDSFSSNGNRSVFLLDGSDSNALSNLTAGDNGYSGIYLVRSSNNQIIDGTFTANLYGIYVDVNSSTNSISGNTIDSNTQYGVVLNSCTGNLVASNSLNSNAYAGLIFNTGAGGNLVRNNRIFFNVRAGIEFSASAANSVALNDIRGNDTGVWIQGSSVNNVISKNNLTGNDVNNIYNQGGQSQTLSRNWFGSIDSVTLKAKINDTPSAWQPYRLTEVDTAAGADTTAPKAPDTVNILNMPSDTSIILEWSAVTVLEESNGGAVGLGGYHVFRSETKDTSSWIKVANITSGTIRYQDTNVALGRVYYYRVTAHDSATFPNESFYSDSQPFDSPVLGATVNIHVNDLSTLFDSFTYAIGSDTTGDGSPQKPFRSLPMAMKYATAGDTIFIDAGTYDSSVAVSSTETAGVNIDKDSITLIGKDSNATVIDPGPNSVGFYGIYADSQTGLVVKTLGVTGAHDGLVFVNVDRSTLSGDSFSGNGQTGLSGDGIFLSNGSDLNTIQDCQTEKNSRYGIHLDASSSNTIKNNIANGNFSSGENSTGITMRNSANSNTVINNTTNSNYFNGIWVFSSSSNLIANNRAYSNIYDVTGAGVKLDGSSANAVIGNTLDSNPGYQIYITGAAGGDTIQKNHISPSQANPDSGIFNSTTNTFDATRNWWGLTDSQAIRNRIAGSGASKIKFYPFRLGRVDTALGADTTAPKAPDTVAIIGSPSDTSIIIEWSAVTALEESNGGAVSLQGYRIYRSEVKDTSSWVKLIQLDSAVIRYQDTGVILGTKYYYRVTAFDSATFENESFFSDSQPVDSAVAPSRVNWFVNDASISFDSFTYANGSDTTGDGTPQKPFRTIGKALSLVTAGDTVFADAGTFAETVVITLNNISLIGRDSAQTVIDPPGASSTAGLYGIYAHDLTGLAVKSIGVGGAYRAIYFQNVDLSTLSGDSFGASYDDGIRLDSGCDTIIVEKSNFDRNSTGGGSVYALHLSGHSNTIRQNGFTQNTATNILLTSPAQNNVVESNVITGGTYGIWLNQSTVYNNRVSGNTIRDVSQIGIPLDTTDSNVLRSNFLRNAAVRGINLFNSHGNVVEQNDIDSTGWLIYIDGNSGGNAIQKNNLTVSPSFPDSGVFHNASTAATITRNWWGTTDESVIRSRIKGSVDTATFSPYRLGVVDTKAGADTTAPAAPTGVTLDTTTTPNAIILTWVNPTLNEETNGGAVAFNGLSIWRLTNQPDTNNWANPVNLVKQTAAADTTWTDTVVAVGVTYYYRLTSKDTALPLNESFFTDTKFARASLAANTTAIWYVNDDTYQNFTDSFSLAAGSDTSGNGQRGNPYRTIKKALQQVKAGDTIYIDVGVYAETVVIETNAVSLIGKDSSASGTVIDPGDSSTSQPALSATSRTRLLVKDLRVQSGFNSLTWTTVTSSRIENVTVRLTGSRGIWLVTGCTGNTLTNNLVEKCNSSGITLQNNCDNNTVSGNTSAGNSGNGNFYIQTSVSNTITGNLASGGAIGFWFNSTSDNNTLSNNTTSGSSTGLILDGSNANTVSGNVFTNSLAQGVRLIASSVNNVVRNNTIAHSGSHGIQITSSGGNTFIQNTIDSNASYQVYLTSSSVDTVQKNYIRTSPTNLDSGVFNGTGKTLDFTRNWWTTNDENRINQMIYDTASIKMVTYRPYRLGAVDTAAGADTTAPAAPTGVALDTTTTPGAIVLTWVNPALNEETNGGALGFAGLNIWRLKNLPDTTKWADSVNLAKQTAAGDTTWTDTDVAVGVPYYYRLTARDTAAPVNESFFTDTKFAKASLAANTTVIWYVNDDTYFSFSDSFSLAVGSDTSGNGQRTTPYRTITKALSEAKAGDTIYVDVGVFSETVVIDTNNINLIGKDSAATVIDPPGSSATTGLYGIYADTQTGLTIKDFGVTGANRGVYLVNVDLSTISGDSVGGNGAEGILLANGSETNTVSNNLCNLNQIGVGLTTSSRSNTIDNNTCDSNTSTGLYLDAPSNTVTNNKAGSNTQSGIQIGFNMTGNVVKGNVLEANKQYGVYFNNSGGNFLHGNAIRSNAHAGVYVSGSNNSVIRQNDIVGNDTGVWIVTTSTGNVITKNNLTGNRVNDVYNNGAVAQTLSRNWWGSTNEDSISAKFSDTASAFRPYRLGAVDTAAGADTTAPGLPAGITLDSTSTPGEIKVTWVIPTVNEETNGGAVGFAGVRVYRLKNTPDTSHWANARVWTAAAGDTTWKDTTVLSGNTYYYRLTGRDTADTFVNESFFTDTVFTTPTPVTVVMDTPNGGEGWIVGETRVISWTTNGSVPTVKLEYSTDSTYNFINLIASSTTNTGTYAWGIPTFATTSKVVRIKVTSFTDSSITDSSNADFAIRGAFDLTRPNSLTDSFAAFTTETITWTNTGTINNVRLEYSADSGSTWIVIVTSTPNSGSYMWTAPNVDASSSAKLRVMDAADTATVDTSNDVFRIWPRPTPPPPDTISIIDGNHQLGKISTYLTKRLKVRVVDTGGLTGVQNAKVRFQVWTGPPGSGSPNTGAMFGPLSMSFTDTYTDTDGYVAETVVLGFNAGVYIIEARNDSVTPARSVYFTVYADGRQVPAGGGTSGLGWRMVGPNKAVPSGWNLKSTSGGLPNAVNVYEWNPTTAAYAAAGGDAVRGRAYWVKDAAGGRVFVPTDGVASDTFDTVSVRLKVGWNQIASGQYFYLRWDSSVAFDTSNLTDTPLPQSQRMTPAQAADTRNVIQNKVYWYTGSQYIYGPATETASLNSMLLKPMVGFWVRAEKECTIYIYPNPVSPDTSATEILQQAPALSAFYKETNKTGSADDWGIQLIAGAGGVTDWQNYVGVKSSSDARRAANAYEAPALAAGYLTLAVRPASNSQSAIPNPQSQPWMAASYAAPNKTTGGYAWEILAASDLGGSPTLSWDNVSNLPSDYEAYLIGLPGGPVNLRKSSSVLLSSSAPAASAPPVLAVGPSDFVAPYLAAAISKEFSFVYPNPGPDATGSMTFKYNLNATSDVSIKIFDVGGKLIKELKGAGTAGGANTITWDTTNKQGQKVGSGVYLYILESSGNKLVDKLAIVR